MKLRHARVFWLSLVLSLSNGAFAAEFVYCNSLGRSAYFELTPTVPDSRQQLAVTAGLYGYEPKELSISISPGLIDVTLYANDTLYMPPASACATSTIGPLDAGDYLVRLWLIDLPDHPTPVPVAQTKLGIKQATRGVNGLWWNSSESGWGINLTQRGNIVFGVWFTYDQAGKPHWYVSPHCELTSTALVGSSCGETIYEATGGAAPGQAFNANTVSRIAVGRLSLEFAGNDEGRMNYVVGELARSVAITRQPLDNRPLSGTDYTDLWWTAAESGWGLSVSHQGQVMFLVWYVYDETGRAKWYVASNCAVSANPTRCSGLLYETNAPLLGSSFDPTKVSVTSVGDISLTFIDASSATLRYSVRGVVAEKFVTRQLF